MKDLFESPKILPKKVREIIIKYGELYPLTYELCDAMIDDLNKVGYTCSYGLDAEPYQLNKLKQ